MSSLIETLINDPVKAPPSRWRSTVRRPVPQRPRELFELLAGLGPDATADMLRRALDLKTGRVHDTFFAVLGRWPTPAEITAHTPTYEPWPHLRRLLMSDEFLAPLLRRVLDAYSEKRRLLGVKIPRCAGAHVSAALMSQHPYVPTTIDAPDLGALLRIFGAAFGAFSRARTVGVIYDRLAPLIVHEPHLREEGDPLGWRYTAAPFRNGDLLFAVVRPPQDIILSEVNAILTGLRRENDTEAVNTWRKRLGPLPAAWEMADWRALGQSILAGLALTNPICRALGDGTAAKALEYCRSVPIALVALDQYELWVRSALELSPEPPSNVSQPILTAKHLRPSDLERIAALTDQDAIFYAAYAARIGADGGTYVSGMKL
jgi:hypothetical protein